MNFTKNNNLTTENNNNLAAVKNKLTGFVESADWAHKRAELRAFYDSIMSDMRSLAALDLPTTRYVDFYVPILLEKLPEKLLTNVLEYPCANPTIDQLNEMIHNDVKRLEQV